MVRLHSEAAGRKPQTVVVAEFEPIGSIRELMDGEAVHYRKDNDDPMCTYCGEYANVWTGSRERWEVNKQRCIQNMYADIEIPEVNVKKTEDVALRDRANAHYQQVYGRPSICNNFEVDAIVEFVKGNGSETEIEDIIFLMFERIGMPSPRRKMKFGALPRSNVDEHRNATELPEDLGDDAAMKRYVMHYFQLTDGTLHSIDAVLIQQFIGRIRREYGYGG